MKQCSFTEVFHPVLLWVELISDFDLLTFSGLCYTYCLADLLLVPGEFGCVSEIYNFVLAFSFLILVVLVV